MPVSASFGKSWPLPLSPGLLSMFWSMFWSVMLLARLLQAPSCGASGRCPFRGIPFATPQSIERIRAATGSWQSITGIMSRTTLVLSLACALSLGDVLGGFEPNRQCLQILSQQVNQRNELTKPNSSPSYRSGVKHATLIRSQVVLLHI